MQGRCPYVLGFVKHIAPRTFTENNNPGEAKGRNHPLIKKKNYVVHFQYLHEHISS